MDRVFDNNGYFFNKTTKWEMPNDNILNNDECEFVRSFGLKIKKDKIESHLITEINTKCCNGIINIFYEPLFTFLEIKNNILKLDENRLIKIKNILGLDLIKFIYNVKYKHFLISDNFLKYLDYDTNNYIPICKIEIDFDIIKFTNLELFYILKDETKGE